MLVVFRVGGHAPEIRFEGVDPELDLRSRDGVEPVVAVGPRAQFEEHGAAISGVVKPSRPAWSGLVSML